VWKYRCVDDVAQRYLAIALRVGTLVPGWIEGYAGPVELKHAVEAEPKSIEGVLCDAAGLADHVSAEERDPRRRAWILGQIKGICTALRWRQGESMDYTALFESCHGAVVEVAPDSEFEHGHGLLDSALPGTGGVAERYRRWEAAQLISPDRRRAALDLLSTEMRRRSRERFGLPHDEAVLWELVSDKSWAGNAEYLGRRQTRIAINTDLPIGSHRLLELVCHEAYPGHHTEHACKDALGYDELSVFVYPTPQALIAEGIAEYAIEALLGDDAEAIAAECVRPAGIAYDPVTAMAVRQAETLLLPVRSNVALMLDAGATSAEAHDYAKTWWPFHEPDVIDKAITNLEARSWRPYESCYPVGRTLCRNYTLGDDARFTELLHLQVSPADLMA
jgi:hypothetical protein